MREARWWLIFFLLPILSATDTTLPVNLKVKLQNMQQAQPPFTYTSYLIFSLKGSPMIKTVRIAIESEAEAMSSHSMKKNNYGVFLFWLPLAAENRINYRYIVNGLWMRDQLNPDFFLNRRGVEISYVSIMRKPLYAHNPVFEHGGQSLYLRSQPGRQVYLVGSFNNWNPFYALMEEIEPGLYYYHLQLPPGEHFYLFQDGGTFRLDPTNTLRARSFYGMKVSKMVLD